MPSPAVEPPAIRCVWIDVGHGLNNRRKGRHDSGAVSEFGEEHEIAAYVALHARDKLKSIVPCIILPELGIVDLVNHVNENAKPNDFLISIHLNASDSPSATGVEVVYSYKARPERIRQAEDMAETLSRRMCLRNRGALLDTATPAGRPKLWGKRGLPILRDTKIPALLVEMGFVTNRFDVTQIRHFGVDALVTAITNLVKGENQ